MLVYRHLILPCSDNDLSKETKLPDNKLNKIEKKYVWERNRFILQKEWENIKPITI